MTDPGPVETPAPSPRPARTGVRPTRSAAGLLAVLTVATVALRLPPIADIALLAVGSGCVLADMVFAFRARLRVERSTLPTLARQVPHALTVAAEVDGARSVRIRQPVPPELAVVPSESAGAELVGELVGRHRGVHAFTAPVVRVAGPIGLGTCDHSVGEPVIVTVLPDLPRARRLSEARRRGRSHDDGRIRSRLGLGTEFEAIREYSPDDDIRQVNWLATARVGRPMTNQYRIDDNRDLICLVDTGRLMASPVGDATRLDVALDALAVLAVAADDAGDRVGAVAFAGDLIRQLPPRRRGAEPVVRALFDLEPVEIESDYDRAFQAVAGRKRALVVLFTDLVDAAAARTLLAVMPTLARRHVIMVVSCRDPDLDQAIATPPVDVRDALRARVALDLLVARRRTVALLRRSGVSVVEAPPGTLGPACASAYVRIKQSGIL
ncbi:MAG: DUF58 domain-containing protein [Acidimicrobiales bacterium]